MDQKKWKLFSIKLLFIDVRNKMHANTESTNYLKVKQKIVRKCVCVLTK